MKHKKQLLYIILLVACMVLLYSMPVFASELTEADVEQAVAEQGKEAVTGNVFMSWCRMLGGQFFLLLMNAWCLRLFTSMVGTFLANPLSI